MKVRWGKGVVRWGGRELKGSREKEGEKEIEK